MSDSRSLIQDVLRPGERLLWAGQPQPWRLALPLLAPLIFIVVWAAIPGSVFLAATSEPTEGPPAGLFLLIPGIFVAVGSLMLLSLARAFFGAWRTHYAVTDQRGVILVDVWPRSVQSYGPDAFAEMTRTGDDDVGTILFGAPVYGRWQRRGGGWTSWPGGRPSFKGIEHPRRVETLIHDSLLKNRPTESAHR